MTIVLGIYLTLLSLAILYVIRRDAVSGMVPLFSARTFFLAGLLLFQSVSGALTAYTDLTEIGAEMNYPAVPAFLFSTILTVFTVLFLFFYRKFDAAERLALPRTRIRQSGKGRLVTAGVLLVLIGVAVRFGGGSIPYVSVLLPQISAGVLCAGTALVAMAWARSSFNVAIALVLVLCTIAAGTTLLVGAFGRREILGLLFAICWALYWEKWRFMPASRLILRIVVAGIGMILPFLVFSGARVGGNDADRSLGRQIEYILSVDPRKMQEAGIAALSGQFAGGISMWIIDQRTSFGGYYPLHSMVYFCTMPIPRDFWPGKPVGLGAEVVDEAGIQGVAEEHSWGPGLVGHLYHDIVLLSLPLYAAILAFAFRYMDARTIHSAGRDPLAIVIFGSALGQILGMPRGDVGLFAFNLAAAYAGAWLFGRIVCAMALPIDHEAEAEDSWEDTWEGRWDEGAESGDAWNAEAANGGEVELVGVGADAVTTDRPRAIGGGSNREIDAV